MERETKEGARLNRRGSVISLDRTAPITRGLEFCPQHHSVVLPEGRANKLSRAEIGRLPLPS